MTQGEGQMSGLGKATSRLAWANVPEPIWLPEDYHRVLVSSRTETSTAGARFDGYSVEREIVSRRMTLIATSAPIKSFKNLQPEGASCLAISVSRAETGEHALDEDLSDLLWDWRMQQEALLPVGPEGVTDELVTVEFAGRRLSEPDEFQFHIRGIGAYWAGRQRLLEVTD